ncbi:hypothetical protein TSAR_012603 [Trichomalopsis sarcophagae]|uniref:Uncharacterized protein n=1 Tax=Trichomalopsis sarcophagae TaxID=543379 RepID=A0A232EQQ4_9HYME|nr:hypothetical protein TSAR_012603 [Trichomalopsis sarcophagae]
MVVIYGSILVPVTCKNLDSSRENALELVYDGTDMKTVITKNDAIHFKSNNLISAPFMDRPNYYERCLFSGHIPPKAFKYLDYNGFIVDKNQIPILYLRFFQS